MDNSSGRTPDGDPPRVIEVTGLAKDYRVCDKPEGFLASVRGLFRRTTRLVEALRGVDLSVGRGEFLALLGPNGAGKTTFLKLLSGIITPSRGSARVLGHVPWERADAFRRRFALVMGQRNQLWWDLPAAESFRLHREIYRIEPDRFARVRDELVDLLDVRRLMLQPVRELSLGERMKLELVAALLHEPEVLFLDEPTLGLDVNAQARVRQFLAEYNRRTGATVLLTSHYMADITALCPRVLLIHQGRLFHDGPLDSLAEQLAPEREVRLELESPVDPSVFAGLGRLERIEGCDVRLLVSRDQLTVAVAQLLERFEVRDLDVTDPPIEELIGGLFRQGRV